MSQKRLVTGQVHIGAVGTPLPPTDNRFFSPDVDLDAHLRPLGYLTLDGVTITDIRRRGFFRGRGARQQLTFTVFDGVDIIPDRSPVRRALTFLGWSSPDAMSWVFRVLDDSHGFGVIVPRGQAVRVVPTLDGTTVISTQVTVKAWPNADGVSCYMATDSRSDQNGRS